MTDRERDDLGRRMLENEATPRFQLRRRARRMDEPQSASAEEARKANQQCHGAPQYFPYPPPSPI